MKLVELNEGARKELVSGELEDLVTWLQGNTDSYTWINDEEEHDPSFDGELTEMPNLSNVETLDDLQSELNKVDLSYWSLVIEA